VIPTPDTGTLRGDLLAILTEFNDRRYRIIGLLAARLGAYYEEAGGSPGELRTLFIDPHPRAANRPASARTVYDDDGGDAGNHRRDRRRRISTAGNELRERQRPGRPIPLMNQVRWIRILMRPTRCRRAIGRVVRVRGALVDVVRRLPVRPSSVRRADILGLNRIRMPAGLRVVRQSRLLHQRR
jgi:hypothetical protein